MFVPVYQVFAFNFVKRPIISALWYAVLVHFILEPFSTAAILISSAILAISFFAVRFYMAIGSPIPMVITIILCNSKIPHLFTYILIAAAVWMIFYIIAMFVTFKNGKGEYYIDEFTNAMYKRLID